MKHISFLLSCLVSFSLLAPSAPAAAQTCSPLHPGVPNVSVELSTGTPDGSKERREHAAISTALAQALGLTGRIDPAEDVNPQMRVTVTAATGSALPSPRTTANFTAADTFPSASLILRVFAQEDAGDEDAGEWKLVGEMPTAIPVTALTVTVHPFAPSRTTLIDGATTTVLQNFCEPAGNDPATASFVETADIGAVDKQVVVTAPHGGDIEGDTSAMIGRLVQQLGNRGVDADSWDAAGEWPHDASERWHITATAADPESFPGLDAIFDEPDFRTGLPYRYAVAYHGMRMSSPAILLGGRSHRDEKCHLTRRMQDALDAAQPGRGGDVAFYVADVDDHEVSLPDRHGHRVEGERSVSGVRGLSRDNIVNRLSPNEDADTGFGGFQVEISNALRDEQLLMDGVSDGIARGLAELIADPSVADGACDALAARIEVAVEAGELISILPPADAVRREEAWISRELADRLGITDTDVNGGSALPQIRVVVESPRTGAGIANAAVFSVTTIQELASPKVWVHARTGSGDTVAGAHQLTAGLKTGTGVADLDGVFAYRVAPSRSELMMVEADDPTDLEALTVRGPAEPVGNGGEIWEEARLVDDREVLVALPFVGDDAGLAQGLDTLMASLQQVDGLLGSFWRYDADWPHGLTFDRWSVSRNRFDTRSFPLLGHLADDENNDTDTPFRYTLAAERLGTVDPQVIVGGQADRDEKCYLVHQMRTALTAAGLGGSVAFHVEDPAGDVSIPDTNGHQVPTAVGALYAGLDADDVQNRLSANPSRTPGRGAFLVAESGALSASQRDALASGLGTALGHLVETGVPAGFSCP